MALVGLFDFQVNGFGGIDFQNPNLTRTDLRHAVQALQSRDVAGILLTLITDTPERLCEQFSLVERYRAEDPQIAQTIWGYHLEGPWLRPEAGFCGAHGPELMCAPQISVFNKLHAAAGGAIRLVTLAPEWAGSPEFIRELVSRGVHVSLGHTNASDREIDAAIEAGARFCTHLGNGVPAILPRHDNVVQRLLARDELTACFIPDGIHLPPFVLKNLFRAKPAGKALFTTDCMAAAGALEGTYSLGGRIQVSVGRDRVVRDPGASGGFAGSALEPDRGVELTAEFLGIPREEARLYWSERATAAFGFAAS